MGDLSGFPASALAASHGLRPISAVVRELGLVESRGVHLAGIRGAGPSLERGALECELPWACSAVWWQDVVRLLYVLGPNNCYRGVGV